MNSVDKGKNKRLPLDCVILRNRGKTESIASLSVEIFCGYLDEQSVDDEQFSYRFLTQSVDFPVFYGILQF